jgi:hypothetical protein
MADSQVPWGLEALNGAVTEPAWRTKPSWYLVATDDKMIPPDARRAMSKTRWFYHCRGQGEPCGLRIGNAGRCRLHRKGGKRPGSRDAVTNGEQLERLWRRVTSGHVQRLGVARRVASANFSPSNSSAAFAATSSARDPEAVPRRNRLDKTAVSDRRTLGGLSPCLSECVTTRSAKRADEVGCEFRDLAEDADVPVIRPGHQSCSWDQLRSVAGMSDRGQGIGFTVS